MIGEPLPAPRASRSARIALAVIVGVHAAFLLASLTDYRVSIDAGYHVSLARWYGEHGPVLWDWINYGPEGRPNLQGPGLHVAIALVGRLLGGTGDSYVLAHAILAVAQWAAAMWTVVFFARRWGDDRAALFGATVLAGSVACAIPFAIGIPSGWIFIAVPWAIHFFLERKLWSATFVMVLANYTHLGGFVTAPVGVIIAAMIARRWRHLLIVGAATIALSALYLLHFFRYRDWYRGAHGAVTLNLSLFVGVISLLGVAWALRRPRHNVFLVAWFLAPIAWLFQDYTRFVAQASLAGATLGGIFLADVVGRLPSVRWQRAATVVFVAVATLLPFAIPSLAAEVAWAFGARFPRQLDWTEARRLAVRVTRSDRPRDLVNVYSNSFGPALAVYAPIQLQRGHWVEVQPQVDPADAMAVAQIVYVVPVPPTDSVLQDLAARGWLRLIGGTEVNSVVALEKPAPPADVTQWLRTTAVADAEWLAANAVNNTFPDVGVVADSVRLAARRARFLAQRTRAGRLELAALVQSLATESRDHTRAQALRDAARGFGSLAAFIGDEAYVNVVPAARHALLLQNLTAWARAMRALDDTPASIEAVAAAAAALFGAYFVTA